MFGWCVWPFYLVSFAFQKFELCFVRCKHSVVIETRYWETKDCIGFVVVYNEVTYISPRGHVGERPGEIIVYHSCVLVCKRRKTKNIFYRAVVVLDDDRRTVIERSCME